MIAQLAWPTGHGEAVFLALLTGSRLGWAGLAAELHVNEQGGSRVGEGARGGTADHPGPGERGPTLVTTGAAVTLHTRGTSAPGKWLCFVGQFEPARHGQSPGLETGERKSTFWGSQLLAVELWANHLSSEQRLQIWGKDTYLCLRVLMRSNETKYVTDSDATSLDRNKPYLRHRPPVQKEGWAEQSP